jgi:hypothetical protein
MPLDSVPERLSSSKEDDMKRTVQMVLISAAVCFSAVTLTAPASAGISIGLNFGDVSDAYSDGYWDGHHRWHGWRAGEWDRYRVAHPEHSHMWRHDDKNHH